MPKDHIECGGIVRAKIRLGSKVDNLFKTYYTNTADMIKFYTMKKQMAFVLGVVEHAAHCRSGIESIAGSRFSSGCAGGHLDWSSQCNLLGMHAANPGCIKELTRYCMMQS